MQVLPFVLLGLGVDDSFVICNAFGRTDPRKSIPDRMAEGLGTSGETARIMEDGAARAFLRWPFVDSLTVVRYFDRLWIR